MDKLSFDKELYSKTRLNFSSLLLERIANHRKALLKTFSLTAADRTDALDLLALGQLGHGGYLSDTDLDCLDAIDPDLQPMLTSWYVQCIALVGKIHSLQRRDLGKLKDLLNYI